jgi:hypothetical protein
VLLLGMHVSTLIFMDCGWEKIIDKTFLLITFSINRVAFLNTAVTFLTVLFTRVCGYRRDINVLPFLLFAPPDVARLCTSAFYF